MDLIKSHRYFQIITLFKNMQEHLIIPIDMGISAPIESASKKYIDNIFQR